MAKSAIGMVGGRPPSYQTTNYSRSGRLPKGSTKDPTSDVPNMPGSGWTPPKTTPSGVGPSPGTTPTYTPPKTRPELTTTEVGSIDDINYTAGNTSALDKASGQYGAIASQEGPELNVNPYDVEGTGDLLDKTRQYAPGSSYIDESKATVAGQLKSLLEDPNNPLLKQAESRGEVSAQRKGQLGSSMGIGSALGQVYAKGLEIARPDAATFAQAGLAEQAAEYGDIKSEREAVLSSQVQKYTADISRADKNIDQRFAAMFKQADTSAQAGLTQIQQQYKADLALIDGKIKETLFDKEIDAKTKQLAYEQSSSILQNYQVTVENLMTNASFLEMMEGDPKAASNAINQLQNLAVNQVNFIGSSAGIDFTPLLDFYFEPVGI